MEEIAISKSKASRPAPRKDGRLGAMAGRGKTLGDIVSPPTDPDDWDALRPLGSVPPPSPSPNGPDRP